MHLALYSHITFVALVHNMELVNTNCSTKYLTPNNVHVRRFFIYRRHYKIIQKKKKTYFEFFMHTCIGEIFSNQNFGWEKKNYWSNFFFFFGCHGFTWSSHWRSQTRANFESVEYFPLQTDSFSPLFFRLTKTTFRFLYSCWFVDQFKIYLLK